MKLTDTKLQGVWIVEPCVYGDHRGWFFEIYNQEVFEKMGVDVSFVQDNHSFSAQKGTIRGLHYQLNPMAQAKLVRCSKGAIFDVAIDIRRGSPTYGQWFGVELNEENKRQLFVSQGFAHGFQTLTEDVEVQYKVDQFWTPELDRVISWNDPTLNITWDLEKEPTLSQKDQVAPLLVEAENNFIYEEM
ncbi:dTDP-4-dehydrorhamnose 3,5-epimerase [Bacillus carboniphilus]|uniref:dTDP-4-dehydrorhamnose 3,5-epimerase n=1 Tax=Bacillus carboniphilus TaxID=86663 RepID=A0ABY9JS12_9BACI|nr:dTDP-4-dehydrorhamnose 3,5-epimerase [Bacillus carboniphilus]WLR41528.1 dTDP-4-dehydrorhamnose 3,5-epimerase [Bacillus carboniphilus]